MYFINDIGIWLVPSVASALFATAGYVATVRLRRGIFPSSSAVSKQLGYSLIGCIVLSNVWISYRRNSRSVLNRMMSTAESSMAFDFRDPNSHVVRSEEYDEATGVDGEEITRTLLKSFPTGNPIRK